MRQPIQWVPAFELIARIKAEEKIIRDEEVRVAREAGLNEGVEKGMAEGAAKEKLEIARAMKRLNLPLKTIQEATGLSKKVVQEL